MDWLCKINWNAISAIATLFMVLATFITIQQNKRQLKELKRQWDEANRARLTFSIVVFNGLHLLKITNCGTATAYNIHIKFNEDFINNHFSNSIKIWLRKLESNPFCIEAGVSKHYYLAPIYGDGLYRLQNESYDGAQINKWLDEHKTDKIKIKGRYCDTYDINEEFSIDEYINGAIVVSDELTIAIDRLKKSVDDISKHMKI